MVWLGILALALWLGPDLDRVTRGWWWAVVKVRGAGVPFLGRAGVEAGGSAFWLVWVATPPPLEGETLLVLVLTWDTWEGPGVSWIVASERWFPGH